MQSKDRSDSAYNLCNSSQVNVIRMYVRRGNDSKFTEVRVMVLVTIKNVCKAHKKIDIKV